RYDLVQRPSRVRPWRQLLETWRARTIIRAAHTAVALLVLAASLHAQSDTGRADSTRAAQTSASLTATGIAPAPPPTAVPFPVGERLVYGARYGPFGVGTATMEVAGVDTIRSVEAVHFRFLIDGGALWYHSAPPSIRNRKCTASTLRMVSTPATSMVAVPTPKGP